MEKDLYDNKSNFKKTEEWKGFSGGNNVLVDGVYNWTGQKDIGMAQVNMKMVGVIGVQLFQVTSPCM